jgi:hypothetical protein
MMMMIKMMMMRMMMSGVLALPHRAVAKSTMTKTKTATTATDTTYSLPKLLYSLDSLSSPLSVSPLLSELSSQL